MTNIPPSATDVPPVTPSPTPRRWWRWLILVAGLIMLVLILNSWLSRHSLIYHYAFARTDFARTRGQVVEHNGDSMVITYGARSKLYRTTYTHQTGRYEAGEAIDVNYLQSEPSLIYLRSEEPLIVRFFLQGIGLIVALGVVYGFGLRPLWRNLGRTKTSS